MAKRKTNTDTVAPPVPMLGRGASTMVRDGTMSADALADAIATKADGPALELVLSPGSACHLAVLVQRAMRLPDVADPWRATGTRFVQAVRTHFATVPTVVALLDHAADPTRE
jgi:hypothetical protein